MRTIRKERLISAVNVVGRQLKFGALMGILLATSTGCQKEAPAGAAIAPQADEELGEEVAPLITDLSQVAPVDPGEVERSIREVMGEPGSQVAERTWTDAQLQQLAQRFAVNPPPSQEYVNQCMADYFSLNTPQVKIFLAHLRDRMAVLYAQAGMDMSEYASLEARLDLGTNQMADYAQQRYGRPFHHLMFDGVGVDDITMRLESFAAAAGWPEPRGFCHSQGTVCKPIGNAGIPSTGYVLRKPTGCRSSNSCWPGVGRSNQNMIGYWPFLPNAWAYHWAVAQPGCPGCVRRLPCSEKRIYLHPALAAVFGMGFPPTAVLSWFVIPS